MARSLDRYVVVGAFNTALDIALFTMLAVLVGFPPVVANVMSTGVVMTISFFLNRAWVFRSEAAGFAAYARFVAITLFSGLLVQSVVIVGFLAASQQVWPDLPAALAKPAAKICGVAVGMVVNFVGYRWLFTSARRPAQNPVGGPSVP